MKQSVKPDPALHTAESVRAFVAAHREPDIADRVLAVLRECDGKALTKRILPKLPQDGGEWRIRHEFGMTHLENAAYRNTIGRESGVSLLVAHATVNVVVDCAAIVERNPAYFTAREERNQKRLAVMHDTALCQRMATALNVYAAAREALATADAALKSLCEYGEPFSPDEYELGRLVGWK